MKASNSPQKELNKVDLPLTVFHLLMDELLHHEYRELDNKGIAALAKLVDPTERYVHIEETSDGRVFLWHSNHYRTSSERQARAREESKRTMAQIEARENFKSNIVSALHTKFVPDDKRCTEFVMMIAEKIMSGDNKQLAEALGIDVSAIPPLPGYFKRLKGTSV